MLPDRRQIVLKMLINEYIAHALPIGSRTLIDRYNLSISSATVRNELSRLEDAGYLTSPHTSAGRVPTDFGYRTFVDDLLQHMPEEPASVEALTELVDTASELDELLDKTSQVLARFTDCLAIVVPAAMMNISISRITLVMLSAHRLLAVIITEDGSVFNRAVETSEELDQARVSAVEELLNKRYAGSRFSKSDYASRYANTENADSAQDPLVTLVEQEIYDCATNQSNIKPHTLGISRLLNQPEFSDATRLSPIVEKLEDDTIIFDLFNNACTSDLPLVRIGHENESDDLSQISVVASPYGAESQQGMIAVIGPTRMNYEVVIKAVRAAKALLQDR